MKLGILSDIHGNINALEAVLRVARFAGIGKLILAGDLIGYYYHVKEVLAALSEWEWLSCRGNHEDYFKLWLEGSEEDRQTLKAKYGHAYEIAASALRDDQIDLLLQLKHPVACTVQSLKFLIAHGSPWSIREYLYPDKLSNFSKQLKDFDCDFLVLGHTHYQMVSELDHLTIINPGSVGQPRSGKKQASKQARAQWAILETETRQVDLQTTWYDASAIHLEVAQMDPNNNYLSTVLMRR